MTSVLTFDEVFQNLTRIVADALRVNPATITPDTNLIVDLDAESIDLVDIRFRIEEAYGFQIEQRAFVTGVAGDMPVGELVNLITMRRLVEFVMRRKGEAA
jgi:acyl carrier protein